MPAPNTNKDTQSKEQDRPRSTPATVNWEFAAEIFGKKAVASQLREKVGSKTKDSDPKPKSDP